MPTEFETLFAEYKDKPVKFNLECISQLEASNYWSNMKDVIKSAFVYYYALFSKVSIRRVLESWKDFELPFSWLLPQNQPLIVMFNDAFTILTDELYRKEVSAQNTEELQATTARFFRLAKQCTIKVYQALAIIEPCAQMLANEISLPLSCPKNEGVSSLEKWIAEMKAFEEILTNEIKVRKGKRLREESADDSLVDSQPMKRQKESAELHPLFASRSLAFFERDLLDIYAAWEGSLTL